MIFVGFAFLIVGVGMLVFRLTENKWPHDAQAWDDLRLKLQRVLGK